MTAINIREARKAKGITMKELGNLVGATESAISLYERGMREPSYEILLKIAEELDTSVGYLLGAETKKSPTTSGEGMDDFTYAAHGYSGRLTDADKATLIKMMETLAAANEEEHGQADGGIQGSE